MTSAPERFISRPFGRSSNGGILSVLCAGLLGLISACGSGEQQRPADGQLQGVDPEVEHLITNPVFVAIGGFNTCKRNRSGNLAPEGTGFVAHIAELQAHAHTLIRRNVRTKLGAQIDVTPYVRPRWVIACHDKAGYLYYRSAQSPSLRRIAYQNLRPLVAAVEAETGDRSQHPVIVAGHSHGGWAAMQLALQLKPKIRLRRLLTIDPISASKCRPRTYWDLLTGGPDGVYAFQACLEAPSDITPVQRQKIINRIPNNSWQHFYQRNFLPLHSSAFPGGAQPGFSQDVSPFLDAWLHGAAATHKAHSRIGHLQLIWHSQKVRLESDFRLSH